MVTGWTCVQPSARDFPRQACLGSRHFGRASVFRQDCRLSVGRRLPTLTSFITNMGKLFNIEEKFSFFVRRSGPL